MKLKWITSAALALGVSTAIPGLVKADDWRDWRRDRDYHYRHDEDRVIVRDISLRDVPDRVLDRVNDYRHGRRIEWAQWVRDRDHVFYQFRIEDRRNGDFTLQIDPDGHVFARIG
jgi:hypothetical protein